MNRAVESVSAFFPCYNDEATIGAMVEAAASTLDRVGADHLKSLIDVMSR